MKLIFLAKIFFFLNNDFTYFWKCFFQFFHDPLDQEAVAAETLA